MAQSPSSDPSGRGEPITPLPVQAPADARRVALGERLFHDTRLSGSGDRTCATCHDLSTNGAAPPGTAVDRQGGALPLDTMTVFNAGLNFRLNWAGTYRTLESQAEALIESPAVMGADLDEVIERLRADGPLADAFVQAYGHGPDRPALLDALARFQRSLTTPDSRFDRWLRGEASALSDKEVEGYRSFKALGCASCHQGANVGGNLFQRHGIFHPIAMPDPPIVRVPSLRNVATTAPYFHDGGTATLEKAVRDMASAQLGRRISDEQVDAIVAFLRTLTGTYRNQPVRAP
ncbi:cytochrome-c peroxidase [Marinivivus vitaminiproducens]|uniref:cytochrome-c peroxidase n=1 Tax=Marinivivus vitaminiproducens TaxID=3035935 RepID=UPI003FA10AE3